MSAKRTDETPSLRQAFIEGMSRMASTVNVVTTEGAAGKSGVTVSAMSSVSADTDFPTLLICLHKKRRATSAILENGIFCVNLLGEGHTEVADRFAGRFQDGTGDHFSGARWMNCRSGAPRLADALVSFDCSLRSALLVGTHYILIGSVNDAYYGNPGIPLIYANRKYGVHSAATVQL
jgi:flavin reductase (DIM6/NTAB) family NADH-FMN oxidoreductase RutF